VPQTPPDQEPVSPEKFILLGEDDPDDQLMLREVFSRLDGTFRLLFVDSGEQVLSILGKLKAHQPPCLIVLDFNMPGQNGADVLKELNSNPQYVNIPKIIWSTSAAEKYKSLCLSVGAVAYIVKPSKSKELEDTARYMLSLCSV
jgi:CheY-like chemotaxis protein